MIKLYDLVGTVDLNTKKFRTAMKQVNKDFEDNEKQIAKAEKAYDDLQKKIVTASEKIVKAEEDRENAVIEVYNTTIKKREELNQKLEKADSERVAELQKNQAKEAQIYEDAAEKTFRAQQELQRKLAQLSTKTSAGLESRRAALTERLSPDYYKQQFANRNSSLQAELAGLFQSVSGDASKLTQAQLTRLQLINGLLNQTFDKFIGNKIDRARKELATLDVDGGEKLARQIQELKRTYGIADERLTFAAEKRVVAVRQVSAEIEQKYSAKISALLQAQDELTRSTNQTIDKITSGFAKIIAQNKQTIANISEQQNRVVLDMAKLGTNKIRGGILPVDISAESRNAGRISAALSSTDTNLRRFYQPQERSALVTSLTEAEVRILEAKRTLAELAEQNAKIERDMVTDQLRTREEFRKLREQDLRDRRSRYAQQIAGVGFALYGVTQFARAGAQDQQDTIGQLSNTTLAFEKRAEKTAEINAASLRTGRSVKELAVAFREIENVLGSGAKGMDTWRQSTKAAIATNSQIGSVARSTAAIMKLYPQEFNNATEAINILSLAARKSPLEFEDFSNVMGNVVGFAKQVGLSATETTAALSLFSEEQLRSAEAGTQLRNVVAKISTPTKEVTKVLADITKRSGVDLVGAFSTAGVESLGFAGVLAKVDEAAKKLNVSSGDLARSLFPNLRGTVGGTILVEKLDEYLKIVQELNGARKDSTFIEQSYALAMNTTNTQLNRAEQASRQLSQELAIAMLPTLNLLLGGMQGLNKVVGQISPTFKSITVSATAAGAGFVLLGRGLQIAWTFAQNLHPALKIAGVAITALTAGFSSYALSQKQATKEEQDLKNALDGVNRETYKRLDGIASYEKSLDKLFGKQQLTLGQEADKIRMTEDIFKATGVEIKATDDLATAHRKLADAIQIANDKKREQQQLFIREGIKEAAKLPQEALARVKSQQELVNALQGNFNFVKSSAKNAGIAFDETKNPEYLRLREAQKVLARLKSEYEIAYRKADNIQKQLLNEMRTGVVAGLNDSVAPRSPFKTGKTDSQKTEEQRLSKELSQRKSDVDNLYREWLNVEEKLFKIKNGDSAESQVAFQKYISGTQLYKDARAVDLMEDNEAFSFIQNLSNRLLVAWTASAPKLDAALKAQEESKKKLEFALKQENALVDLKNDLRNKIKDLSFVDGEKLTEVEKIQRKLSEVDPLFGKSNREVLSKNPENVALIQALERAAVAADIRKDLSKEIEEQDKQQKDAWKSFAKRMEEGIGLVASIRAKADDILKPPTDRESVLRELSPFRFFSEVKDNNVKQLLDDLVDRVIAFRKASEKPEKTIFDDLPEKLTKIRGEIASITGGDFMAFANTLGITSDDLKNNDKLGFGKAMLEELYTLERAKKSIEEIYKKLKAIRKRETGQTGIPEIDAINEELRRRDQRLAYIDDLENNFKRGIALGVRGGLRQGLRDMRRNIEDALINNASNAIGKLLFDGIRSTGIFDQLFGSTKLSESTQSALSNPELFAETLAQKVLNVRVVDSFGNVPGLIPGGVPGTSSGIRNPNIPLSDGSIGGSVASKRFGVLDAALTYSKFQFGGLGGKVSAIGDIAKFAGLKGIAKFAGTASPYLLANDILGDPLGRAGKWLTGSLFGSKRRGGNSGRSQSIVVSMPNANITSPTDAAVVASDVARNLRNSPKLARG